VSGFSLKFSSNQEKIEKKFSVSPENTKRNFAAHAVRRAKFRFF